MTNQPVTILYIEDNFDNRILVKRILQAAGYDVLEATDAVEGLRIAQELHPDLVLVDINLPEIDGLTFTSYLRTDPAFKHTPIVAITADVIRGNMEITLSAGCDGLIQKPIDVDRLPQIIGQYLERK
jgi:two-component system cell cycle response regulator DivK